MSTKVDYTFKILMLGASSTGKSSLSDRYVHGIFSDDIRLTVGVNFYVKRLDANNKKIKLQIWDLGGEARFRFLLPTYCLGSSGAVFLFDLTRADTLLQLDSWINILREKNGKIPIILVGNKADLAEARKIPAAHGEQSALNNELIEYIEVSAKTGENVDLVFQHLTDYMMKQLNLA